ncbi:MAG: Ku protein [Bryobacterales bacterium]|nr:Ku protein [Bryobacterales bacterium]
MPDEQDLLAEDGQEDQVSTRPFWSGTISFGLVSIPVNLFAAYRSSRVSLRMLGPNGTPLTRRYYSQSNEKQLAPEQMVRGYEVTPGTYVEVTDEELERLAPEKTRDIALQRFVEENAIPPRFFDRSYFLAPTGPSNRAYRLLAATMEEMKRAAIATFVMRAKEYLVAIFAEHGILRAETLRFADELRTVEDVGLPSRVEPDAKTVQAMENFVRDRAKDKLDEKEMRNENAQRLLKLVEKKRKDEAAVIHTAAEESAAEVVDILEELKRSLSQTKEARKPPASAKPLGEDLESRSKQELLERAKALDIPGRTAMSKPKLIEAIRKSA